MKTMNLSKGIIALLLYVVTVHVYAGTLLHASHTVGYLTVQGALTREDSAAIAFLKENPSLKTSVLSTATSRLDMPGVDLVWVHIPDSASYAKWMPQLEKLRALKTFYLRGGKLLLTDFAALLPYELGIETEKPEILSLTITNDWLFDQKGFQGFRGHPVYEGFFGGVFTWDTNVDHVLHRIGYFGDRWPKGGKVVGIEKSYVVLESDNKLMVEYAAGKGKLMSLGAFIYFSRVNAKKPHCEKFISNTIAYLLGENRSSPRTYWVRTDNVPKEFSVRTRPLPRSPEHAMRKLPASELLLTNASPENNFYDVAGRRALVMGRENGGIDELWVHPFRVLRDFEAGVVLGDSVLWLKQLPLTIEIRPESFTRLYKTPFGELKEITFPSLSRAGALIHYELETAQHVSLLVKYRCDLRWMWPYDERALGDVYFAYDDALGALHVKDRSGDFYCVMGADSSPLKHLSGQFGGISWKSGSFAGTPTNLNQVYHAALYSLGPDGGRTLNVALVGTDLGVKEALDDYRSLLARPSSEYSELVRHYDKLLSHSVTVESPDREFNSLWKWTLVGVDRFVARTPRLGTALLAGYSTVNRGWDGAHKISGRPGYAWYFGRDSEWSGFAIDDYGDFTTVRQQLEFLQKYQDMTGKIFHEVSTSGVVHYDASDATPLYVILAAHYLRASGDREFLRKSWPNLKRAMDFLYSTDTDGDLLIENTNVGHGWIEGGKLWPVHTEFYLAGIWAQALEDAAWMASLLGKRESAGAYARDAALVKKKVDTEFWNPTTGCYNYGKLSDGSYNPEPTILPAPVMYFGWLDDVKVKPALTRYATSNFTTDWGTRIVSDESPLYGPQGYHYGAVWPLFTGWTALAEYEYGNSGQAFSHMLNNMYIKNHWALGFVEEVMNGATYKPSGVCPHQCWSETNIIHPGIHGMIGWKPDAPGKSATLAPRFPLNWSNVSVKNLRCWNSVIDFQMEQTATRTIYNLQLTEGSSVTVQLMPEIPEGMVITSITLDGKPLAPAGRSSRGLLAEPVVVHLKKSADVSFIHTGGVGVVPFAVRPVPGDTSAGYRIISEILRGNRYIVNVEGKAGTAQTFDVALFDQNVTTVEGASVERKPADGIVRVRIAFDAGTKRTTRTEFALTLEGAKQ
jgi:hypothetical protein